MVVLSELAEGSSSSSSSSSSGDDHRYDVFLSFRGSDTRLNFTDHLYNALNNANITTFLDDEEIDTGLSLKPKLKSAIKASRASIIVLSENYASSTWCLNELVLILQRHKKSHHIVIPIFYHVEPTDVRKQKQSFEKAMADHNKRMEAETNMKEKCRLAKKIKKWKKALAKVANLKGMDAKGRQETKFIEEIVINIYQRLGHVSLRNTSRIPLLNGMGYFIESITSWLKDGSLHTADILFISGLAGIGKTSLARYVHGLHCRLFKRSSFVEGVNEKCVEQVNGLRDVQKQLCDDISKSSPIQIHDVFKYTSIIENALARQKVFIVLDDIDSLTQLDALLGNKGFHPGSKIIITTKDASLSEKYQPIDSIAQPNHRKFFLEGLDEQASLQLLSYHAFKGSGPKEGYEEVSAKLLAYCQGHPLALKVLGESLHKVTVAEWEECIEGLKEEPNSRIQKALQMSFDSMPSNNDKELFKHIACFFVGKDKNYTQTILKGCSIRTSLGIRNLINRCLLTIGPWNELKMHQLLQEMGRDLVRQESPNKPWKRSRLWCHRESFHVLEQNRGTGKTKGLILDMKMLEKENLCGSVELKTDALSKMDNLMLLQLNYLQRLNGSYKNFPQKLRWLCMHGFPLKFIPSDIPMEYLVALDMSYSNLESFGMSYSNLQPYGNRQKLIGSCSEKDNKLLRSLKILNLSFCKQLRSVGGFFELPALERLILANCIGLIEVCESIEHCDELVHIDLSYCNMLKMLPRNMVKLKKLEALLLVGCNLGEFPSKVSDFPKMPNNIGIKSQTSSYAIVETIPRGLRSFVISSPRSLVCLSLKDNHLSNESFPMDLSSLSMLKELYLDGNPIVSLPYCVRNLLRLEKLSVKNCLILKSIDPPPVTLKHLIANGCYLLQNVAFDHEMSPLIFYDGSSSSSYSGYNIEGMLKKEALADVKDEVLRSLGWINLEELMNNEQMETYQMDYEFGIFTTMYDRLKMPNWISDRRDGSSISFTIPSSPNNLRGLNICHVFVSSQIDFEPYPITFQSIIKVSNITKHRTWMYKHYSDFDKFQGCATNLSHWMFGKNEMEDGDHITITIVNHDDPYNNFRVNECGVSFVYDEDNGKMEEEEEEVLGYYKSWNHIIGGDLSPFQTIPGEYRLCNNYFFTHSIGAQDKGWFRAFSKRKSDVVDGATRDQYHANLYQKYFEDVSVYPSIDWEMWTQTAGENMNDSLFGFGYNVDPQDILGQGGSYSNTDASGSSSSANYSWVETLEGQVKELIMKRQDEERAKASRRQMEEMVSKFMQSQFLPSDPGL